MILGIDPGGSKPHAIAGYNYEGLVSVFKTSDIQEISTSIKLSEKVYIEDQYYGGNAATLILLSQKTGMIMGLCELHGVPYEMVASTTWESYFNLPKKPRKSKKDPDRIIPSDYMWKKQHYQDIINKAQEYTDIKVKDEDYGAAILIGLWGVKHDS